VERTQTHKAAIITSFINNYSKAHVSFARQDEVEALANSIEQTGVKFKDACHIASAIIAECDYFISTDIRLLKYKTDKIKIVNPVDYFVNNDLED